MHLILRLSCFTALMACTKTQSHPTITEESTTEVNDTETIALQSGLHTLIHDGMERSFLLHVPENVSTEDFPVVFVLHGYTDSAEGIQWYSGMNAIADEHEFIVAYPQGTTDDSDNAFFNVGYDFHPNETVDDVGFILALLDGLQRNSEVSMEAAFATGMSNGGEMSYMLACQASDRFLAVASVTGVMFDSFAAECQPERPPAVMEIHGTEDSVNWYEGDPTNEGGWGVYLGIEEGIAFWAEQNSLDQFEQLQLPDISPNDGSTVELERYWAENTANEVLLYRVIGGDHEWPGSFGNQDINSSQVIWEFFAAYR